MSFSPDREIYTTGAAGETEDLAASLARYLQENGKLPVFIAFYGDLGVGKTAFIRGFASVLTPGVTVKSPTFALVNEYRCGKTRLCHFDMYRITSEDDLYSIGFYDYLESGASCLCEWSENIPFALPPSYWRVEIEKEDVSRPDERKITIRNVDSEG